MIGKRATLKTRTLSGWRGKGTIVRVDDYPEGPLVLLAKDGERHDALVARACAGGRMRASEKGVVMCCREELVVHRK